MTLLAPSPPLSPTPLDAERHALLQRLTDGLDAATLWWLSGFLAGLARPQAAVAVSLPVAAAPGEASTLTIVYGSQTGNARRAAERLRDAAVAGGAPARLLRADAYPLAELKRERQLLLVFSTQGDGEPSDDARGFVEHLLGRRAPRLDGLRYAVLGLGDSSYPKFCEVGRLLDRRLAELGGQRLQPLAEADVEVDAVALPWQAALLPALAVAPTASAGVPLPATAPMAGAAATREAPAAAEVLLNQRISGRGSARDVRHLEFAIDPARLDYQPGDAAGIWPLQSEELVAAVLAAAGLDGEHMVSLGDTQLPLHQWLRERRELTRLGRPFLQAHAARSDSAALQAALADPVASASLLQSTPLLDLLLEHPAAWQPEALVAALRPLQPRLYSIASAREAVGDELHLTVAHAEFDGAHGRRYGCASHHLAGLAEGDTARLYIEPNPRFRLPADAGRDIVMIGPGTGVAPFRGFVQARAARGGSGRNWLLFGNRHFREDFLYQLEWQQALADGRLHRLDVAFSRDGAGKVYVQHRLQEQAARLWDWLQGGAHLYVCGDAAQMARDVHATLLGIAQTQGGLDDDAAADFLSELERQGRYARDVY